jgi:hypothetical protein
MAYDFVQQRDTGTKARVNERQVIKTIEDQHKYDMPDQRRLFVAADYVNMPTATPTSGLNKLASALAEVKPQLMDYFANKEADANAQDYEQGKLDKMQGLSPEEVQGEYRKKGYEFQTHFLAGEDLGSKLEADIINKDPEADFNTWYQQWWQDNAQGAPNNPEFLNIFNRGFSKSLTKARGYDITERTKLERDKQDSVATESMFRAISEIRGKKLPITTDDWKALKNDMQPGYSNQQTDALFFNALERYSLEHADVDSLNVLYEKRDGGVVPALIDNPKYTQKIRDLRDRVITKFNTLEAKREQADEKAAKDLGEQASIQLLLAAGKAEQEDDPARTEEIMGGIRASMEEAINQGIKLPTSIVEKINSYSRRSDKDYESETQRSNYDVMRLNPGALSLNKILKAKQDGQISASGYDKLLTAYEADRRHKETLAKQNEKGFDTKKVYKDAVREIDMNTVATGVYIQGIGQTRTQDEQNHTNAVKAKFREIVEENIYEKGMNEKDAVADALPKAMDIIKANKWNNTGLEKDKAKIEKPVQTYLANPQAYHDEVTKNGKPTLPLTKTEEKQVQDAYLRKLADEAKAKAKANKKPK